MHKLLSSFGLVISFIVLSGISLAGTVSSKFILNNIDGSQTLLGHVPGEVANSTKISHLNAIQTLNLRINLPINNESQLNTLLQGLYDPQSPNYHHFLTPDQFAQEFGTSVADLTQVKNYLTSEGLNVTNASSNGLVLQVSGNVNQIEHAFGVTINNYLKSDGSLFFATATNPIIPAPLAGKILSIGGLDNVVKFKSNLHAMTTVLKRLGTGPDGYMAPSDIYKAYNLSTIPSNGNGQKLALFEMDGYLASDIAGYEAALGLSSVPLQNTYIDGFNGVPTSNGGSPEVTLDIELVAAFAPGLNDILVYEGNNSWQTWVDEWTRLANDKDASGNVLVPVISCSWGLAESYSPEINFDDAIFKQMAAQGQSVFVASGDSGAYDDGSTLSVDEPAAQPFVTAVGISKLSMNSDGSYASEAASTYSGGGISKYQALPAYQQGMISKASMGSTAMRNLPDVAMTADPATAYSFYINGSWSGYWGSSLAAPIWASFIARVNQGMVTAGKPMVGYLNPELYQLFQSSNGPSDFHDVTSGNNQYYPAGVGYDLATGLGSFNGANLYKDLTGSNVLLPTAPVNLSANVSLGKVVLSWSSVQGALSYNVKRSTVSGGPYTTIASAITTTSYTDLSTQANILYYYVVSGVNSSGQGANSSQIGGLITSAPLAPTGLIASAGVNQVALSWNSSNTAIYYNVKRSTVSGGPYTTIATSNSTSFTDKNPLQGVTIYYYVVSAVNSLTEGPNSNQVQANMVQQSLSAPTGLAGVGGNKQVVLNWKAPVGALSYNVLRSTVSNASFTTIAAGLTSPSYTDVNVANGYIYYYEVNAVYANGQSPNTQEIYVIPAGLPVPPATVTAVAGNAQATVSFSGFLANGSVITGFTVTSSPGSLTATGTSSPMTVIGLTNGTVYTFTVKVTNGVGTSPASAPSNSVTPQVPPPPAPTGLQGAPGNNQVSLSWNASAGASAYNVKKATSLNGPFTLIASAVKNLSFIDTAVNNGTSYFYVVTALNSSGSESANSNEIMVVPLAPLTPPVLTAVAGVGSVSLSWNAFNGAEFYYVLRSTVSTGPFYFIASPTSNSYKDQAVTGGVSYYYVVEAYVMLNGTGQMSPTSAVVKATPTIALAAPTNLLGVPGNNLVKLTWGPSATATSYNVKRSTVNGGPYTILANVPTVTFTDQTAQNNTAYYYTVSAVNANGESPNSNQFYTTPFAPAQAPSGLAAVAGKGSVALSWNPVAGANWYYILRSTNANAYSVIAASTAAKYTDTAVSKGVKYYYEVETYENVNGAGSQSPASSTVSATPS